MVPFLVSLLREAGVPMPVPLSELEDWFCCLRELQKLAGSEPLPSGTVDLESAIEFLEPQAGFQRYTTSFDRSTGVRFVLCDPESPEGSARAWVEICENGTFPVLDGCDRELVIRLYEICRDERHAN